MGGVGAVPCKSFLVGLSGASVLLGQAGFVFLKSSDHPVVCFEMSGGLLCLWVDCLLNCRFEFLFC